MKRVLVTGNAGAGKTTFSKVLANKTGLPLHCLDSIVWKSGWVKTADQERYDKIKNLVDGDGWIIDGVSRQAFDAADTIFFIDMSLTRCLFNIVSRFLKNGIGTRNSLPENCPEYIGVFKAIKVAFYYNKNTRPWLISSIEANVTSGELIESTPQKKIVWIKNYQQLLDFY